jgi:hypothetical protein
MRGGPVPTSPELTVHKPNDCLDFQAYSRSTRLDLCTVIALLDKMLGTPLLVFISGVSERRTLRAWADGTRKPRPAVQDRLRLALRLAELIAGQSSEEVAQAWFQALNPLLDDRAPARLIRDGDLDQVGPAVAAAGRSFVLGQ